MKIDKTQLIVAIAIYLVAIAAGLLVGYAVWHKSPTVITNTTDPILIKKNDSLRDIITINEYEKTIISKRIDSLNKVINYNEKQYEKELKSMGNINIVSDDSITRFISNYLHNKQ